MRIFFLMCILGASLTIAAQNIIYGNKNLKFRIWNSSRLSILSKCSQSLVILNNLDG